MSIRLRLIFWYSFVFAGGLTAFAVVVWFGTRGVLHSDVDTWLARQADGLEQFLRKETQGTGEAAVVEETREFSSGLPRGGGVQLFSRDGRLLLSRPEATIKNLPEQPSTVISDQASIRVLTRRITIEGFDFRFALWRSLDETEQALSDLQRVLLTMMPVFLLLSVGGGWFLSRRALRPVDDITAAARNISLQNLPASLPVPPHRDELQRLCEAWNEMLRRIETSSRQLRQFTADASHELRTPVALIRATSELMLRHDRSPEEYRSALNNIRQETDELTHLIENLMELARADAGQYRLSFAPVDLKDLVREVRPHVEPMTAQSNLDLAVDLPAEHLAVVGDRGALRRLLLVLLDNAVKFTAAPGRVEVRAKGVNNHVVLEVEDTGIGISGEDLPRIFDRFYQADSSRSGSGVGLGLSIAQWIVQSHNGRIEVHSSPGHGALFRIFLPSVTTS
jgi:two-component system, OmpR family, heavy metal sensor histidine kinase CusS